MFFFKKPESRFLIRFLPLILIWYFLYQYLHKLDSYFNLNNSFLNTFSKYLGMQANYVLRIFNLKTKIELHGDMVVTKILDFPFNHGVWIGEPCNGVKIFGLFSIFIISFKGKFINKVWFIPTGILILHSINILRISALTYISAVNPEILDFNHNITFQLIIYLTIFIIWYIWINNFSHVK